MSTQPWDVYAEQLFPLGYGHALWIPELSSRNRREFFIGDVGWLKRGELHVLFNSMKDKNHPINQRSDMPPDFAVFSPPNLLIGNSDRITTPIVVSRGINLSHAQADLANTGILPSAGVGWPFRTTSDSGALVMLNPPGKAQDIQSRRHIVNYMRDNFDSWLKFANGSHPGCRLDLRPEDIVFVCGTLKTTQWGMAAFQGSMFHDKEGYISGQAGSSEDIGFSVEISGEPLPTTHHKDGPRCPAVQVANSSRLSHPGDDATIGLRPVWPGQCLFIHYYKMKRRFWRKEPMLAGAGPHQLPSGADSSGSDASPYEFEAEADGRSDEYDPVNYLLDYILRTTEANTAIASDLDLIALFKDRIFPEDIYEAITQLSPPVDLDDDGVGTISVKYNFVRRDSEEYACGVGQPQVVYTSPDFALSLQGGEHPRPDSGGDDDHLYNDNSDDYQATLTPEPGEIAAPIVHDQSVTALAYSADGKYVASGSEDATIIVWDAPGNAAWHRLPVAGETGHADTIAPLTFSHDNIWLASASHDEEIIVWAVRDGRKHRRITPGRMVHSLAYTPDGSHLIAGADDGTLYLWDAWTYEEVRTLNKNARVVTFITFSSNGQLMATGGTEDVCYVWETAKLLGGEPLSVFGGRSMLCAAAFSPDGRRIITGSDDGSSHIWNAYTGEALAVRREHKRLVSSVAFSPDGRDVVSWSSDSTVKVSDSFTGDLLLSLVGHEQDSMINMVQFSPDGRYIITAGSDGKVRLWNSSDGTCQTVYNEHAAIVVFTVFAPDASTFASGLGDGTVRIRPLMLTHTD